MTPIVMVHGAFCGGWVFETFEAPFRRAGHEVHRPDLRGHGPDDPPGAVAGLSMATYADDIAAYCARLPEPPILIGHSLGGLVAQLAAARAPVRALALLAPSAPWGVAIASLEETISALGVQMMGPFWTGAIPPDRQLMLSYGLNRAPRDVREAALKRLRHESGRAIAQTLNWWLDPLMTTSLGAGPLKVPSLALVGDGDRIHAPASVRQTARRIGATFEIVPGMGHWLPAEAGADGLAQRILDWLPVEVGS
jgi:pimeloyl-ACP methyl ester carboxylesterase